MLLKIVNQLKKSRTKFSNKIDKYIKKYTPEFKQKYESR